MATEKKALWVVFRPETPEGKAAMREKFKTSYPIFKDMPELYFKSWWVNEEKGEWGALYIFNSEKDLEEYIASDRWLKKVPEKYGCKPAVQEILDSGPILCKGVALDSDTSYLSD